MIFKKNEKHTESKTRSDKKIRVNPSLDQDTHQKLLALSIATNMTKTKLAEECIKFCLNNPTIIEYLQKKYPPISNKHKIIPIIQNGTVFYE